MKLRKKKDAFTSERKPLARGKEELRSLDRSALHEVRGGATAVEYAVLLGRPVARP